MLKFKIEILDKNSLNDVVIGVPQCNFDDYEDEEIKKIFITAIKELEKLGAKITEVNIPKENHLINGDVLFYEFPKALEEYFKTLGEFAPVKTLEEIVKFNEENLLERVPYDQKIFERCLEMQKDYDEKYQDTLSSSISYGREIDSIVREYNLDALAFLNTSGVSIAAKVGYPSVTVPAGYTKDNRPIGLTFTATGFTEDKLLSYAYECAYNKRKSPLT